MVAYTRCPYCGHPEVERSAAVCPICEGELSHKLEQSVDVALGSLSDKDAPIELDDLLTTPSKKDDSDVRIALELRGNAPTLAHVDIVHGSDTPPQLDRVTSLAVEQEPIPTPAQHMPTANRRRPTWRGAIYVYLLFVGIGLVLMIRNGPDAEPSTHTDSLTSASNEARLGLEAISQGRYAAAIQFLEKATAAKKNITLLPSLALAYSRTSQIERSRQVMVHYREAMKAQSVDE